MTLYLTDHTTCEDVTEAFDCGFIKAVKLYPAGATTNSEFGVTNMNNVKLVLKVEALNSSDIILNFLSHNN
jgi:dihydroorotase